MTNTERLAGQAQAAENCLSEGWFSYEEAVCRLAAGPFFNGEEEARLYVTYLAACGSIEVRNHSEHGDYLHWVD